MTFRGARVVTDVAAKLETGVRLLRVGGDDSGSDVEVGRTSSDEREALVEMEVSEIAVNGSDAISDTVCTKILLEEAKAELLRLDAPEARVDRQARENEEANRADARSQIEVAADRAAAGQLLERVPPREKIIGRMPMTLLPLEDAPCRGEAVDRHGLSELGLECDASRF